MDRRETYKWLRDLVLAGLLLPVALEQLKVPRPLILIVCVFALLALKAWEYYPTVAVLPPIQRRHRTMALLGMILCGFGVVGFSTWYFWPIAKPETPTVVSRAPDPAPAPSSEKSPPSSAKPVTGIVLFDPTDAMRRNTDGSPRIFVTTTPDVLMREYSNMTTAQANSVVSGYLGKWMALEGPVLNVTRDSRGGTEVDLGGPTAGDVIDYGMPQLHFAPSWNGKLDTLIKGQRIKTICRIDDVGHFVIALGACELIDS